MANPNHLLWLDLESTGSDPHDPYAAILEIGAILTTWDPELTEVARANLLVRPPGNVQDHEKMWQNMVPVVQQMHRDNGLWADATGSDQAWLIHDADRAISDWLSTHTDGPVPVAGSGVGHLDLPYVKVHMPHLATRLTYWPLDIGNFRRTLELAGRGDQVDLLTDVDAKPHRALADVELHIAEARRYLAWLGQHQPVAPSIGDHGSQHDA